MSNNNANQPPEEPVPDQQDVEDITQKFQNMPANSNDSLVDLERELRENVQLREALKRFLILFYKEKEKMSTLLRESVLKLLTNEVLQPFTLSDSPRNLRRLNEELPTIYKMIIDAEDITQKFQNMPGGFDRDNSLLDLENLLKRMPANSEESLVDLERELRENVQLREALKRFLFLFYKENEKMSTFLRDSVFKLVTNEVLQPFTLSDSPKKLRRLDKELPTIHKMIIDAMELFKQLRGLEEDPRTVFKDQLPNLKRVNQ